MTDERPKVTRWLISFLSPYKKQVIIASTALGISASTWLLLGQGVRLIIDNALSTGADDLFIYMIGALLIVSIGSIATYVRFYYMVWLGERVSGDIRRNLFNHLITLSPAFYEKERTGEIISRFTSDTTLLQTVIGSGISMALRSSVVFIGALVLMLVTSPSLTLYVFLSIPLILIPVKLLGRKVRVYAKESQDKVAGMGMLVDENFHEIKAVQAYTGESQSIEKFSHAIEQIIKIAGKRIQARALLIASVMLISMVAIIIVAWVDINAVILGNITAGQLVAFMFYAVMAGGSIATVSEVIGEIQKAAGASERIIHLLNTQGEIEDTGTLVETPTSDTVIQMKNVEFAYDETPVLKNIELSVNAGQKIAFVGHSGAGKSTLFDLLMRFYDINKGSISLYGQPIEQYCLSSLRSQFALVSQDPVIFAGSVADNIAFGDPTIGTHEIKKAASLAFADEFIDKLAQKYDTELGERGVKLSGGQKQRIAIARAIASNRPLLLLDEATSALDAKSERMIKQALDSLMQEKTTLIIAHRLSTVVNADRIFVLESGEIIASGTHQELYANNGHYREFVNLQLIDE